MKKDLQVASRPTGTWVQTDRKAHEKWATLAIKNPRAASLLHLMISKMGRNNALVVSQKVLASLSGCSVATVKRSLKVLKDANWVQIVQIGSTNSTNAYVINDRVAWSGKRDGIRYSLFSASIIASDQEQPDLENIGFEAPLEKVLELEEGEQQLPVGDGLEPPSQPSFLGLEPDIPSKNQAE